MGVSEKCTRDCALGVKLFTIEKRLNGDGVINPRRVRAGVWLERCTAVGFPPKTLAKAELISGIINIVSEPNNKIINTIRGKIQRGSLILVDGLFAIRISGGSLLNFVVDNIGHSE